MKHIAKEYNQTTPYTLSGPNRCYMSVLGAYGHS